MARQRRRRRGGGSSSSSRSEGATPSSSRSENTNSGSSGSEEGGRRGGARRPGGRDRGRGRRPERIERIERREAPRPAPRGDEGPRHIPATVLFRDVTLVEVSPPRVERGDLLVAQGVVAARGRRLEAPADAEIVDGRRMVLMPGMVDAWTRPTADPLPGFASAIDPVPSYEGWLDLSAKAHREDSIISSGFLGGIGALGDGTTSMVVLHESPDFLTGALGHLRDVFLTLGVRCVLGYRVSDRHGAEKLAEALEVTTKAAAWGGTETLRMAVAVAPLDQVSEDTLTKLVSICSKREVPFVAEVGTRIGERADCEKAHGASPVERLLKAGALGALAIVRVGSEVTAEEAAKMAATGASLVHTPRADLLAGHPAAAASLFAENGTVGTAELEAHVFRELRTASDHASGRGEPLSGDQLLSLVAAGHRLAGRIFGIPLGSLEQGAVADLVLLDYDPPLPLTTETLARHFLSGLASARVLATMVSGRFLYREGCVTTVETDRLLEVVRRASLALHERLIGAPWPGLILEDPIPAEPALEPEEDEDDREDEDLDEEQDAEASEGHDDEGDASEDAPGDGDPEEASERTSDTEDEDDADEDDADEDEDSEDSENGADEDDDDDSDDDLDEDEDDDSDDDLDEDDDDDSDDDLDEDDDDDSDDDLDEDDDDDSDDDLDEDDDEDEDDEDDDEGVPRDRFGAGIFE